MYVPYPTLFYIFFDCFLTVIILRTFPFLHVPPVSWSHLLPRHLLLINDSKCFLPSSDLNDHVATSCSVHCSFATVVSCSLTDIILVFCASISLLLVFYSTVLTRYSHYPLCYSPAHKLLLCQSAHCSYASLYTALVPVCTLLLCQSPAHNCSCASAH
jgi:hypothetical protein